MNEQISTNPEKTSESIPTPKQVREIFDKLIGEGKFKDRRKLKDEKGLYLWEVVVSQQNEDGGATEYSYMRKGRHPEGGQAAETAIHVVFFDKDGLPNGGESVAKHREGKWVYHEE